jgi:hypothetical protein
MTFIDEPVTVRRLLILAFRIGLLDAQRAIRRLRQHLVLICLRKCRHPRGAIQLDDCFSRWECTRCGKKCSINRDLNIDQAPEEIEEFGWYPGELPPIVDYFQPFPGAPFQRTAHRSSCIDVKVKR